MKTAGQGRAVNGNRAKPSQILFLADDCPYPPTSGARLRTFNILRELARTSELHALFLGDETPDQIRAVGRFCGGAVQVRRKSWERLNFLDKLIYNLAALVRRTSPDVERSRSRRMTRHIERHLAGGRIDTVWIEMIYLAHYARHIRRRFPNVRIVLDTHNLESALHRRLAKAATNPLFKVRNLIFSRNLRRLESQVHTFADVVTAVSLSEQRALHEMNLGMVAVEAVPNGVDTAYYAPLPQPTSPVALIFCGLMSYGPNVAGVSWFANEVLPLIGNRLPGVRLMIVGKNPTIEVRRLSADPRISVVGEVLDVRPYYQDSTVAIVPLFSGGGTRLKVLEAMALGRVVVSTSIGAEGIDASPGLRIADTSETFAETVVDLLGRSDLTALSAANVELAQSNYSWEIIGVKLRQLAKTPVSA